ncbi:MAG: DUF5606 domain-containing protein [Sphingobacteriales bacterium]|nr:MAG: DUF5606 domain-containing protein [Sphingobacteriales bacterium]
MKFKDIIAISKLPGLYEMITAKTNGAIVRSLQDGKTQFVSSRMHNFSPLDKISVYTTDTDSELLEVVIKKIQEYEAANAGAVLPSHKDNPDVIRNFLTTVLPNADHSRIYVSDIQKLIRWYELLKTIELTFEEESNSAIPENSETNPETTNREEVAEE